MFSLETTQQRICVEQRERGKRAEGEKRHVKERKDWDLSYGGLIDNEDSRRR